MNRSRIIHESLMRNVGGILPRVGVGVGVGVRCGEVGHSCLSSHWWPRSNRPPMNGGIRREIGGSHLPYVDPHGLTHPWCALDGRLWPCWEDA